MKKIKSKIFIDKDKLASEKIINLWESFFDENNTKTTNWRKLKFILMIKELRNNIGQKLKKFFPS